MKINELVEGRQYGYKGSTYIVKDKILSYICKDGKIEETTRNYNEVIRMDFTEIPQFTPNELTLMKLIDEEYTWIARDKDNDLFAHEEEPSLGSNFFSGGGNSIELNCFSHVFTTIKPGEKYEIVR